jgi:hypothetical protein
MKQVRTLLFPVRTLARGCDYGGQLPNDVTARLATYYEWKKASQKEGIAIKSAFHLLSLEKWWYC